ncbi:MAG TPA: TIGR03067 domain-containing protein [Gemmataceae bacterium]|nr:TIGR03067 domain-containing protein [Gemmataceae bacterium]
MRVLLVLAFFVPVSPAALAEEAAKKDPELFQGTWALVSAIHDGRKSAPEKIKTVKLTFSGEKLTVHGEKGMESAFKLDPSKKPKEIDVTPGDGPDRGKVLRGIYELMDEELKICIGKAGKERPTEFASKENSGVVLIELKRER